MKLTKRHLRRIIREELQLLREQSRDPRDSQTMTGFDNFGPEAEAEDERDLLMAALEKEYGLKVKTTKTGVELRAECGLLKRQPLTHLTACLFLITIWKMSPMYLGFMKSLRIFSNRTGFFRSGMTPGL